VSVLVWAGVAVIGGLGAVLRLLVDGQVSARLGGMFPFGTLVVNLSGAVLLGLISGMALNPIAALLAGTAAVGSYTTFSTWMFESQRLAEDRQLSSVAANVLVSLAVGLVAAALGRYLGRLL
jgi:fluoride exporter